MRIETPPPPTLHPSPKKHHKLYTPMLSRLMLFFCFMKMVLLVKNVLRGKKVVCTGETVFMKPGEYASKDKNAPPPFYILVANEKKSSI